MLMYAKAGVPRNAVAMRETEGEGDRERASCGGLLFSLLARVTDCYISFLAGRVQQSSVGIFLGPSIQRKGGRAQQVTSECESNGKAGGCMCYTSDLRYDRHTN